MIDSDLLGRPKEKNKQTIGLLYKNSLFYKENPHNDLRVALKGSPNNEKRESRDVKFHIMISIFRSNLINC